MYNTMILGGKKKKRKSTKKKRKSTEKKRKSTNNKRNISIPVVGDKVTIIIKPYKNNITEVGIVKRVLTKKKYHSRGHKVMLCSGTVGRILRILKKNKI